MKNLLYFFLGICALSSCAPAATTATTTTTTTTAVSVTEGPGPVGQWNYAITGTPDGNFAGIMTITQVGQQLTATLAVRGNELPIDNFVYNKDTQKLTGELQYSGLAVAFEALMTGDELNGAMSEGGMGFPFKATRRK